MNSLAHGLLNVSTETVVRVYTIQLPWWVLPTVVVIIVVTVAVAWLLMRRWRPRR